MDARTSELIYASRTTTSLILESTTSTATLIPELNNADIINDFKSVIDNTINSVVNP